MGNKCEGALSIRCFVYNEGTMDWSRTKPASASRLDKLINLVESLSEQTGATERTSPAFVKLVSEVSRTLAGLETFPLDLLGGEADAVAQSVASRLGKQVEVAFEHPGIEFPFQFKEPFSRALLHSMRNAVDHGIESPEARRKLGKDPTGKIRLAPRIRGESLELRIIDDGRGPDLEALVRTALEKKAVAPIMEGRLLLEQKLELLFLPGLSTVIHADAISGRGVGLEAIAAEWKALGGQALAELPETGSGFELILRAPLEHFGAEAIPVEIGDCRLWIPVAELVKVSQKKGISPLDVREALGLSMTRSRPAAKLDRLFLRSRIGDSVLAVDSTGSSEFRSFRKLDPIWTDQGEDWLRRWLVRFPAAFATRARGQIGVYASAEMLASLVSLK